MSETFSPARRQRSARSFFWSVTNRGGRELIVLVVYLATVRFLHPTDLGLNAIIVAVIILAKILGSDGLHIALLQKAGLEERIWNEAFWHSQRSFAGWALSVFMAAAAFAAITGQLRFLGFGSCAAVGIVFFGVHLVPYARLQRDLHFDRMAGRTIASSLISGGMGLWMAAAGWGVWSLLLQAVVYECCNAIITWKTSPWKPGPPQWSSDGLCALLKFGRPLVWANAFRELSSIVERGGLGFLWGTRELGLYHLGRRLGNTYQQAGLQPVADIADTLLPQSAHQPPRLCRGVLRMAQVTACLTLPALGLGVILPGPMIHTLLSSEWEGAIPLAPWFALSLVPSLVLWGPLSAGLRASGRSREVWHYTVILHIGQTLCVLATATFGIHAAVVALGLFPWLTVPWTWQCAGVILGRSPRRFLMAVLPAFVAIVCAGILTTLLLNALPPQATLQLACGIPLYLAVYAASLALAYRRTLQALFREPKPRH